MAPNLPPRLWTSGLARIRSHCTSSRLDDRWRTDTSKASMGNFDVSVLHRSSRRDEVQCDLIRASPLVQSLGGKFGAMVDHNTHRQSAFEPKLIQYSDHPQRRQ